jgi:hypothetical protein
LPFVGVQIPDSTGCLEALLVLNAQDYRFLLSGEGRIMTVEKEKQAGWKQKIVHEMAEYWINFVYLALVFFAFTSYRRLILAEYQVSYLHYGIAVIEAAVLAKIILLGEAARIGRKHEDKPLIVPTLHKTIVFAIWVIGFKVLEHMIGGLLKGKGLAGGFHDLINKDWYEILANTLVMISAFIPFFAIKELGRVLGREKLRALFFRKRVGTGSSLPPQ